MRYRSKLGTPIIKWLLMVTDGYWWLLMVTDGYWWLLMVTAKRIPNSSKICSVWPTPIFNDGDKPISNPTTSEKLTRKKWSQCSYKGSIDLTLGWSKSGRRAGPWRFKAIKQKKMVGGFKPAKTCACQSGSSSRRCCAGRTTSNNETTRARNDSWSAPMFSWHWLIISAFSVIPPHGWNTVTRHRRPPCSNGLQATGCQLLHVKPRR